MGLELVSVVIFCLWFVHAGTVAGVAASRGLHRNLLAGVLAQVSSNVTQMRGSDDGL